ncbi:glutamate receptor ionotropic, delta-2-like isoform X2 [Daphnia pulex]|uniref:glutamate receptor ionotropic, delta-2-like isoform X2 n=1 Tax=Daphnia pulex TaxID=6669 RepID=UPI001EE0E7B9|nr:glutamate receptor ionotropic, delta-2-like isoform X2 [Daphnia pulex]
MKVAVLLVLTRVVLGDSSYLSGKHLVVGLQVSPVHLYAARNSSGYILKIDGVAVRTLNALSKRFNFTYSILQVNDTRLEKQNDALPGLAYYMEKGKCDLVLGVIVMTPGRFAVVDFAGGYTYTSVAIVIPMPKLLDNSYAVAKPFQVWIGLLLVTPITAVAIYFFLRPFNSASVSDTASINETQGGIIRRETTTQIGLAEAFFQIFGILFNQGGSFPAMRPALFFIVGSWCLSALVLGCAYNSLLISYILGSNYQALVVSPEDLAKNSKIQIAVNKGNGVDIVLSSAQDGMYKNLGDRLRANPKSRCETTQECINLVKFESYAYLHTMFVAIDIIEEDYKTTGECNLALARKTDPVPGSLAWALPKRSPYTKLLSQGFMELHEAGLIDEWIESEQKKRKNATLCMNEARKRQEIKASPDNQIQITLAHFSGAFYVLVGGYFISFVSFIRENVYFRVSRYFKRPNKNEIVEGPVDEGNNVPLP